MLKKMLEIVMVAVIVAGVAGAYFRWMGALPIAVTQTQKMSSFDVSGEGKVVMILEITQKQIMTALDQLDDNAKWGGITKHDINIMRGESGGKVVYTVIAEPGELNSEVKEKIAKTTVNLKNLFTGENPFERTFVRKDEDFDADAGLDGITF